MSKLCSYIVIIRNETMTEINFFKVILKIECDTGVDCVVIYHYL